MLGRVDAPRNFTAKVFRNYDSDDQPTRIVNSKVAVQVILNVYPIIHKHSEFRLFACLGLKHHLCHQHSLQPSRADFTEHLLKMCCVECIALFISQRRQRATPKMIRLTAARLTKLKGRMSSCELEHDIGNPVSFNGKLDPVTRFSPRGFDSRS